MLPNTKKKTRCEALSVSVLLICIMLMHTACNTRIEGCLDPDAFNFELTAERDCADCCTYPILSISLSQKWDDRNFNSTDTLMDIHQQPYQIIDLKYFLSSWYWRDTEGQLYTVDSSDIGCEDAVLRYTNDIGIIDTRQFTYTLGTIRHSPIIDSIHLALGLTQDFNCVDESDPDVPASLTSTSALWNPQTGDLSAVRLIVKRDLTQELLDTVYIHSVVPLGVSFPFEFVRGSNTQWRLSVNYAEWFSQVDKNDLNSFTNSLSNGVARSMYQTP